jgi:hypothetical protein
MGPALMVWASALRATNNSESRAYSLRMGRGFSSPKDTKKVRAGFTPAHVLCSQINPKFRSAMLPRLIACLSIVVGRSRESVRNVFCQITSRTAQSLPLGRSKKQNAADQKSARDNFGINPKLSLGKIYNGGH